jgi:hypothetical protein
MLSCLGRSARRNPVYLLYAPFLSLAPTISPMPIDDLNVTGIWSIYGATRPKMRGCDTHPHLDHLWPTAQTSAPSARITNRALNRTATRAQPWRGPRQSSEATERGAVVQYPLISALRAGRNTNRVLQQRAAEIPVFFPAVVPPPVAIRVSSALKKSTFTRSAKRRARFSQWASKVHPSPRRRPIRNTIAKS